MKIVHFKALCPYCGIGHLVASTSPDESGESSLFFITSNGDICLGGICSNCEVQISMVYPIMGLLSQCPTEENEATLNQVERMHIFKRIPVL